jgi:hypothetical protein
MPPRNRSPGRDFEMVGCGTGVSSPAEVDLAHFEYWLAVLLPNNFEILLYCDRFETEPGQTRSKSLDMNMNSHKKIF